MDYRLGGFLSYDRDFIALIVISPYPLPSPHYHCRWLTLFGPRPWYYSCHPFSFSSPNPLCSRDLPYTVTFFPFHCIFQDLYTGRRIGLGRDNGRGIYELVADEPLSGLQALFVTSITTSSLLWHRCLGHPCFDKLKKTLPWPSLTQFMCESCQLGKYH